MHHPTDRITHTTAFVIPIVGTRNSSMGPPRRIDPTINSHHERTLLPRVLNSTFFFFRFNPPPPPPFQVSSSTHLFYCLPKLFIFFCDVFNFQLQFGRVGQRLVHRPLHRRPNSLLVALSPAAKLVNLKLKCKLSEKHSRILTNRTNPGISAIGSSPSNGLKPNM